MTFVTVGVGVSIASLAMSAHQSSRARSAASAADQSNQAAANATYEATIEELNRQAIESQEIGEEEKSERIREADRELSTLRAAAAEVGLSRGMLNRFSTEVGFHEGMDLSQIDTNTERFNEAIESQKNAAKVNKDNAIISSATTAAAQRRAANNSFLGDVIRVGGSLAASFATQSAAKNTTPTVGG